MALLLCHLKTVLPLVKMSQEQLADELNISRNTVTNWIKGAAPRLDTAYDVIDLLNARAEELGLQTRWKVEDIWHRRPL